MGLFGPPNVEKLKAKRDVKGLIKALNYKKYSNIRWSAANALGQIGDAQAVEALVAALNDKQWSVQEAAVKVLDSLGWQPLGNTQRALRAIARKEWTKIVPLGSAAVMPLVKVATNRVDVAETAIRAYPNNPAARKATRAQAKCRKAM